MSMERLQNNADEITETVKDFIQKEIARERNLLASELIISLIEFFRKKGIEINLYAGDGSLESTLDNLQTPNQTLGETIEATRKKLGLSRSELARRAGICVAQVWRIERRGTQPRGNNLRGIAEGLSVPVGFLFGEAENDGRDNLSTTN